MSQDWKKGKSLKYIRTGFITFSKWKLESIGSSMRSMNKNGKQEIKRDIIQDIYNLMNLGVNSVVIRLINNKSVEVMQE